MAHRDREVLAFVGVPFIWRSDGTKAVVECGHQVGQAIPNYERNRKRSPERVAKHVVNLPGLLVGVSADGGGVIRIVVLEFVDSEFEFVAAYARPRQLFAATRDESLRKVWGVGRH